MVLGLGLFVFGQALATSDVVRLCLCRARHGDGGRRGALQAVVPGRFFDFSRGLGVVDGRAADHQRRADDLLWRARRIHGTHLS